MPFPLIIVIAACGFVGLFFFSRRLFDPKKGIQARWEGARRHLSAIAVGLCAFVVLFALLQTLHLFESDLFSWRALLDIMRLSFVLLVAGAVIIVGAVLLSK